LWQQICRLQQKTVVMGVFYMALAKYSNLPDTEFERLQTLQDSSCYQAGRAVCRRVELCARHSVATEKPSVEENSEGSWIAEVLKTLFHVCNCKRTPINPFIRTRTLYFRHAYPPTCDNDPQITYLPIYSTNWATSVTTNMSTTSGPPL
jgi:hypothetical protein